MLGAPLVERLKGVLPGKGSGQNPNIMQRFKDFFPAKPAGASSSGEDHNEGIVRRMSKRWTGEDSNLRRYLRRRAPAVQQGNTKPTHYPHLLFHGIRTTQLVSSIIVMGIMSYFLWNLHHDGYPSPWTFILLLTVSVFTIIALSVTIVLHLAYGLNPRLNLYLNGGLFVLWGLGFSLLSWWSSSTLGHVCSISRWEDDTGVSVCRTYKALFAFSMFGLVSTIAASCLDVYVYRRSVARGSYDQMHDLPDLDQKVAHPMPSPRRFQEHTEPYNPPKSPFVDVQTGYDSAGPSHSGPQSPYDTPYDAPKTSADAAKSPFEDTRVSHDTPKPSAEISRPTEGSRKGYTVPEEQFKYSD